LSGKLRRHSSVFSIRLKTNSDGADVTSAGKLFQTCMAAQHYINVLLTYLLTIFITDIGRVLIPSQATDPVPLNLSDTASVRTMVICLYARYHHHLTSTKLCYSSWRHRQVCVCVWTTFPRVVT